jgi:hypothetical protein
MVFWIWIVKLFWIVLFHLHNIIIVSFDTKLDFWILLIFFGIVCSTWCIFSMWSINCVTSLVRKVVSFGYAVCVLLNFYYFGSWYFKFEF